MAKARLEFNRRDKEQINSDQVRKIEAALRAVETSFDEINRIEAL